MSKQQLIEELRQLMMDKLDLEEEDLDDIGEDKPLTVESLGIDSIDILELTVQIEKKYQAKIGNVETAQKAFKSMNALAEFIMEKSPKFAN